MRPEERQQRIAEFLQTAEFAALEEIAKHVQASVSTVRRDLSVLEASGNFQRTHGGARIVSPKSDEFAFSARDTHQLAEKEAIGKACAELIAPNQSIILDAGTTVYHVARYLESKAPQIITNSLPVANLFSGSNRHEVHLSGCPRSCAAAHTAPVTLLAVSPGHYDLYFRDAAHPGFGRLHARTLSIEAAGALLRARPRSNTDD